MKSRREFLVNFLLVSVCTLLLNLSDAETPAGSTGNGFGENYDWVKFEDAFNVAAETNKPLMILFYRPWCGACKALKPQFAKSSLIKELSEQFVMVNTDDEGESNEETYQPDGGYIPRLLFFASNGTLLKEIINEGGNSDYKYYYHEDKSIAASMRATLKILGEPHEIDSRSKEKVEL